VVEKLAETAEKIDRLVDRIDALLASSPTDRNAINVTHTQAGNMGFLGGMAVASCGATILLMIAFMVIENRSYTHLDNQVDQLRAWSEVHSKEIARIQAQIRKE
jgi:hypothetical protein